MAESQKHLLLVEDEAPLRQAVAEQLADRGFKVEQCDSGEAAVARLADFAFDVIITDLRLPGMDGRALVQAAVGRARTGIERVFVTTITTGTSGASVTGIAQRVCSGGVLGSPVNVDAGGWPIGFGNGIAGTAVVETFVARSLLGSGTSARVYLLGSGNGDGDAIVAAIEGGAIELALGDASGAGTVAIPAHSPTPGRAWRGGSG